MRELICTLRIASDLEKIGDLSKGIARRTLILMDEETQPKELVGGLAHLSEVAMNQIKTVVDAYIERDLSKADRVFMADDDIDTLYTSMFSALISHMSKDPKSVRPSAHLLFCAKNIERIGDHATDIAGAMRQFLTRPETGGLKGFLR